MYGDWGGDRKGNLWGVGKAKHGRKGVTRQTQQNVQQVLQHTYHVNKCILIPRGQIHLLTRPRVANLTLLGTRRKDARLIR